MLLGAPQDVAFHVSDEDVEVVDQFEVDLDSHSHGGVRELLDEALAVDLVGDLSAELGQVPLAVGVLYMCQEISPFADQECASSHQVACGSHLGWVGICDGEHAAA